MGLKIENYKNEKLGVTLNNAYAQIQNVSVMLDGTVHAIFKIQQDRDSIVEKESIEMIPYRCEIDKDLPLFSQVYVKAKEDIFKGWEDDIVADESEVEPNA